MPMHQVLMMFVAAVLLAAGSGQLVNRLRSDLLRPTSWLLLFAVAGSLSAASGVIEKTRHTGTGFTTAHGWPKPFYFQYLSETGAQSHGWSLLYFVGNSLAFAGGLLMLWTIWRVARR